MAKKDNTYLLLGLGAALLLLKPKGAVNGIGAVSKDELDDIVEHLNDILPHKKYTLRGAQGGYGLYANMNSVTGYLSKKELLAYLRAFRNGIYAATDKRS